MTTTERLNLLTKLLTAPVSDAAKLFMTWFLLENVNDDDQYPCDWHSNAWYAKAMDRNDPETISRYVREWTNLGILKARQHVSRAGIIQFIGDKERGSRSRATQNRLLVLNVKKALELPGFQPICSTENYPVSSRSTNTESASLPVVTTRFPAGGRSAGLGDQTREDKPVKCETSEGASVAASQLPPPVASSTREGGQPSAESKPFPGEQRPAEAKELIVAWGFGPDLIPTIWRSELGRQVGVSTGDRVPKNLQPDLHALCCKFVNDHRRMEQDNKQHDQDRKQQGHRQAALGWLYRGENFKPARLLEIQAAVVAWADAGGDGQPPLTDSDWNYVLPMIKNH